MNVELSFESFDEAVIFGIEHQMLPCWEHHGLERLVTSANTLEEFRSQPMPENVRCWEKKRKSRKALTRNRSPIVKAWPEEDQHSTRFPCLVFVRKGQAEFRIGDYVAQCPQGHFMLFRPGVPRPAGNTPFLEEPREGKHCELWWFKSEGINNHITLSMMTSTGEEQVNSGHYYIVNESRIVHLFHFFIEEMTECPTRDVKAAQLMLQTFFLLFLKEIKSGRFYNRGIGNLPKSAARMDSPIEMARQYIEKNLNHPLTIDIVAQAVFMARTNFIRQFREEVGETFHDYLTERRLNEAKFWLLQETCSVETVGHFVGLKPSRFHQLFRKRFDMTPTEFRKQHRNV